METPASAAVAPAAVIVLAAGAGTRMKSRTPKVLHTLGGRNSFRALEEQHEIFEGYLALGLPETTGLPELITMARIWPRPAVVISSGSSASAWAPATISRPAIRLVCGAASANPASRNVST